MKKRIKDRSLGREKSQKKALLRTLLVSLIDNKKINTTLAKAKELKSFAEKRLTLAKKGLSEDQKLAKIRILSKDLPEKSVKELFEIAKVSKREGGYTRIIKLMNRKSDASPMAMIEWTDKPEKQEKQQTNSKKKNSAVKKEEAISKKK